MTLHDKIGQLAQIDIHLILNDTLEIDDEKVEHYFGTLGIGSLLVTPFSPVEGVDFTALKYRSIMIAIQNVTQVYNRPPVLVGIDSVHGANYVEDAIMLPQQLNLASTWNTSHAYFAGYLAARDTRAAGIGWIFSPILGLGIESKWSRMYETFGEDPYLVGSMGQAIVRGIQYDSKGDGSIPSKSAACAKHFVGYSAPRTGHDRSPSWIPPRHLHQYFVTPWRDVLSSSNAERAMTVMESYTEYDGVPNIANKNSLRKLLRQQLDFDGVLITDYQEVENIVNWHKNAKDLSEAVKMTLSEGSVDISMIPFYYDGWKDNVLKAMAIDPASADTDSVTYTYSEKNPLSPYPVYPTKVDIERIDESVERVMRLKESLNMFNEKIIENDINLQKVGNEDDRQKALDIARDSVVLVKNDEQILPIEGGNLKIHVTGPTSNYIKYQSGGWSIQWQGVTDDSLFNSRGTTVLEAAKNMADWDVSSSCGVDILGNECSEEANMDAHLAIDSDYVIICVGEEAYTEKPGDIRDLRLPQGQINFVKQIKSISKGKIILVYFGGRPRLLDDMVASSDSILLAFLPGPDGGQAVVDIISGESNPNAKLPITYPKYPDSGGVPYWHAVSDMCTGADKNKILPHYEYTKCEVEWPFGHGLSYTQFVHRDLKLSRTKLFLKGEKHYKDEIDVSLKVQNVGGRSGQETVMLFLFIENRYVTPEHKILWYFEKIELKNGEEKAIQTKLSIDHLRHIGPHDDSHLVIQPGMSVKVGVGRYVDCRSDSSDLCSDSITVVNNDDEAPYLAPCEVACNLWELVTNCDAKYGMDFTDCLNRCISSTSPSVLDGYSGWGWNYVSCIGPIVLDKKVEMSSKCQKLTTMCRDVFKTHDDFNTTLGESEKYEMTFALIAGLIGVCLICISLFSKSPQQQRHRGSKKKDGEIEFVPIQDRSIS